MADEQIDGILAELEQIRERQARVDDFYNGVVEALQNLIAAVRAYDSSDERARYPLPRYIKDAMTYAVEALDGGNGN